MFVWICSAEVGPCTMCVQLPEFVQWVSPLSRNAARQALKLAIWAPPQDSAKLLGFRFHTTTWIQWNTSCLFCKNKLHLVQPFAFAERTKSKYWIHTESIIVVSFSYAVYEVLWAPVMTMKLAASALCCVLAINWRKTRKNETVNELGKGVLRKLSKAKERCYEIWKRYCSRIM